MMPDNKMDEFLKSMLPGYVSPVPEDMWERIVRKKDEDRKGLLFFFRLFGIFILGFGIAGILLFRFGGTKEIMPSSKIISSTTAPAPDTLNTNQTIKNSTVNSHSQTKTALQSINADGKINSHAITSKRHNQKNKFLTQIQAKNYSSLQTGTTGADTSNSTADSTGDKTKTTISASNHPSDSVIDNAGNVSGSKPTAIDSLKKETGKKSDSTKKSKKGVWSVDVYGSPDYPFVFGQNYEQMRLSYTLGFRLNRSFGKRFSGSIGIQYSVINFYGSDSIGGASLDHLKRLDVPVLVGYTLGSNSLTTVIHAGLIFNLNTKYQPAFSNYPDYFKTNTGLGAYLGVNLEKHINYHFSVFGEPYLRFQITPMTDGGPNNFINVTGLSLGLRYYFKK
jgi:hypothetical protein